MELLRYFETTAEAENLATLLYSHGIVTHVGSHTGTALGGMIQAVSKVGLWVVLEHQFEDAKALMDDDTHIVSTGLSSEEMAEFEGSGKAYVFGALNKAILGGVVLIGLLIYALIWIGENW